MVTTVITGTRAVQRSNIQSQDMNPKHISLKPGKTFVLLLIMALETLQLCTDVFCQAFLLISPVLVSFLGSETLSSGLFSGSLNLKLFCVLVCFFLKPFHLLLA